MKIGMDISVLYVAKAGVLRYHYNLLKAMIQVVSSSDAIVLYDYPAIHGNTSEPPNLEMLSDPRVSVRRPRGIRHRKLSRMSSLEKPAIYPIAQGIDRLLDRPWRGAANSVLTRQLSQNMSDVDVFHVSDVFNWKVPGTKSVTTIHDLTTLLYPEYHTDENIDLQAKKIKFAQEEADVIIAASNSTKRDIVRLLNVDPDLVQVVYYGIDPWFRSMEIDEVRQQLKQWNLEPGSYIFYTGTIEPRKNLVRLLEAYDQIRHQTSPPHPKLVLAGSIGWKLEEFTAQIESLNLAEDIKLLGSIDNSSLPFLYNGARLFVYPSLYEGFGLPPLEAMACGTPVITSDISSLPEVVGQAAILINPVDTEALAKAMLRVANDAGLRAEMSKAGIERAQLFTWQRAAAETLGVYRRVITN